MESTAQDSVCLVADDTNAPPLSNLPIEYHLGKRYLYGQPAAEVLFTDNETNRPRVYGHASSRRFVKDAFHRALVNGQRDAVNSASTGTKSCLRYHSLVPPGGSFIVRLRLAPQPLPAPLQEVDRIVTERREEADEFYNTIHPPKASEDERRIQRQAFAGLLWTKQIYLFDVDLWLDGDDPKQPPPSPHQFIRNRHWRHLNSMRVLSMPDKWEYPWFAAWDLAFHTVVFALIDPEFAKEQLWLMLFEQFQHPNGQIPAYEWEFADLNPPVHAWAVWRVYNTDRLRLRARGLCLAGEVFPQTPDQLCLVD
jgi:hypothetical protein